jgi:hypothetical protein
MTPKITHRDNFIWLFFALIFLLFSGAVFAQFESELGRRLVNFSLTITMLIAVWSMERKRARWLNPKIGMSLVIASLMIGGSILDDYRLAIAQLVIVISFLSLTTFLAWRQVMFSGHVDRNKIVGAICIYMLIGVVWAFAYLLVEALFPGSMNGLDHREWQHNLEDMIYYSMVTLTTLGYGDITPDQPLVRFLAYMESITGIFYTTVLVASLIGVRLAAYKPGENKAED